MIHVYNYTLTNGSKSDPFQLNIDLENSNQLKNLRKELEEKHKCTVINPITNEKIVEKYIYFTRQEK